MPDYLVVLRRQRLIYEHATVTVTSSAAHYAERDAKGTVDTDDWIADETDTVWTPPMIAPVRGE